MKIPSFLSNVLTSFNKISKTKKIVVGIALLFFGSQFASANSTIGTLETTIEEIPYLTEYQYDEGKLDTYVKVLNEGSSGKKEVKLRKYKYLGVTYKTERVSENIMTEPTKEVRLVGKLHRELVTETEEIPYSTQRKPDSSMVRGKESIIQYGASGTRLVTYEIITLEGVEKTKKPIKTVVTRKATNQIVSYGTKRAPVCDSNYSGACVPIAYDVDCAGGSGNGPAYVYGPVYIIGYDIYDLDRDGDGVACEW